jgi:hypothetical protein
MTTVSARLEKLEAAAVAAAPVEAAAVVIVGETVTDADRAAAAKNHPGKQVIFVKTVDARRRVDAAQTQQKR